MLLKFGEMLVILACIYWSENEKAMILGRNHRLVTFKEGRNVSFSRNPWISRR
jgi:hypothetical protein